MELQVTLTLSDRLFALLEDKLPSLGRRCEKAITKELGAQARSESSVELKVVSSRTDAQIPTAESEKPRRTRKVKADAPEEAPALAEAVEAVLETPQPTDESTPLVEASVQQPGKELTEEDIRAAMHRTRQRFEGEDYKNNTDSEAYKKYHKQLTGVFKQIAVVLGADKPSALPADRRASFIAECDALIIDEKGFIASPPAPF